MAAAGCYAAIGNKMSNPISYIIFAVIIWALFNFIEDRPKSARFIEAVFKYIFYFLWPVTLIFSGYVYSSKGEQFAATLFVILGMLLVIPCTVIVSDDPGRKWTNMKNMFLGKKK